MKESEEKFRSFTENSPDFIVQLDKSGKIMFTNYLYEGMSLDEVIGTSVLNWLPKEHQPRFESALRKIIKTRNVVLMQWLLVSREL